MGLGRSRMLEIVLGTLAVVVTVAVAVVLLLELRDRGSDRDGRKPSIAKRFDADFLLGADGALQVVEDVVYDFRSPRAQLTRHYGSAPVDTLPVDVRATRDGEPETVSVTPAFGGLLLKIGRPGNPLTGVHRYQLSYRIPDALDGDQTEFTRQLVSAGYAVRIEEARLTVHLPAVAREVDCMVGVIEPCQVVGEGSRELVITARSMPRNTGILLRVLMEPAPAG